MTMDLRAHWAEAAWAAECARMHLGDLAGNVVRAEWDEASHARVAAEACFVDALVEFLHGVKS